MSGSRPGAPLRLAYNTNGWPQHELPEAARQLAALGYDGIAITPDTFHLNPLRDGAVSEARQLRRLLDELPLAVAVETGARFLLDPARKHQPTLLSGSSGARARLDLLRRCFDLAVELRAETFSFWAGTWAPDDAPTAATITSMPARDEQPATATAATAATAAATDAATAATAAAAAAAAATTPPRELLLERLCAGAGALLDHARGSGVAVCFEPEPGMAVASLAELDEFLARLARPELRVMLDVGHVPVTERERPGSTAAAESVTALAKAGRLGGLQLDDCRGRVHEHLLPGEGETDWRALLAAIAESGYVGLASLELPRHGHDPVSAARRALAFLRGQPPG